MGGEGEGDRIGMREGGARDRSISVIGRRDLRTCLPGGYYINQSQAGGINMQTGTHTREPRIDKTEQLHTGVHALA